MSKKTLPRTQHPTNKLTKIEILVLSLGLKNELRVKFQENKERLTTDEWAIIYKNASPNLKIKIINELSKTEASSILEKIENDNDLDYLTKIKTLTEGILNMNQGDEKSLKQSSLSTFLKYAPRKFLIPIIDFLNVNGLHDNATQLKAMRCRPSKGLRKSESKLQNGMGTKKLTYSAKRGRSGPIKLPEGRSQ